MRASAASIGRGQRFARRLAAALIAVALLPGAAPTSRLEVDVAHLRSTDGLLRLCVTSDPANFPECVDDARAITRSVSASVRSIAFDGLAPGVYAVAVLHDQNANGKLDTFAGIPREGFGFSRNPGGLGPPRFAAARFDLTADADQTIRMRYIL